jgi:hypothetical protein
MQAVSNPITQTKWKQVFQDALFEWDPTRLQPKLEAAQKAIADRLAVLSGGASSCPELMQLEDAKRTLQYLARHEQQT